MDSQTIETALDDEVATFAGNESKRAKKRKANGKTTNVVGENTATEDLLDILDNFLITTSNADFSSHLTAPSRSTAPESITVSK